MYWTKRRNNSFVFYCVLEMASHNIIYDSNAINRCSAQWYTLKIRNICKCQQIIVSAIVYWTNVAFFLLENSIIELFCSFVLYLNCIHVDFQHDSPLIYYLHNFASVHNTDARYCIILIWLQHFQWWYRMKHFLASALIEIEIRRQILTHALYRHAIFQHTDDTHNTKNRRQRCSRK